MVTKTALIVAYYFPPIATIGSMRPLGFCRYLERYGWRPRVLTTEPNSVYPPIGIDESLCNYLEGAVQIDRVPHPSPEQSLLRIRNGLRRLLAGQFLSKRGERLTLDNDGYMSPSEKISCDTKSLNLKATLVDWLLSFPDPQCFWSRPAVRRLSRVPRGQYPDIVYATGAPWTGLLVGKALAKRFSVPFVADLRDPWTYNPNSQCRSAFLFRRAAQLERSVYEAATFVVANTAALRARLINDHPDLEQKFVTITNGFDTEALDPAVPCLKREMTGEPAPSASASLEISYFGNVYRNRSPLVLLQAVKELIDENRICRGQLRIRFVGVWEPSEPLCEELARDLEGQGVVKREPPVPHTECIRQMMAAEILLVLLTDSPLQIPGKIYDYLAAGRPLLVIGGEGATAQLVEQYKLGVCWPNQIEAIKKLLLGLVSRQTKIPPPPREGRSRFEYRELAKVLASVFDAACTNK